ncbi:hypothetical protein B0H14DRAFT_3434903 [Mycena olivaceomarginata]|nr:hypothetical protein B0H14DRAFT_3434903 [Mycena olivaceomarginata]
MSPFASSFEFKTNGRNGTKASLNVTAPRHRPCAFHTASIFLGLGTSGATEEIKPNPLCTAPPARSSLVLLRVLSTASPQTPSTLAVSLDVPRHVLTPTQPHLSLQIPARRCAGGLALPVPVQGADTPLCGSHARPGLGKLGDLRADATGAGWRDAAPAAAAASGSAKHGVGAADAH